MRFNLGNRFKICVIRKCLARKAPDRIPLMGDAIAKRDYFTIHLSSDLQRRQFYISGIDGQSLQGFWFNEPTGAGFEASIPLRFLSFFSIDITHYYKELEITHHSVVLFRLDQFALKPLRTLIFQRIAQGIFNRRILVRFDRIRILRHVYENTIADPSYVTSSFQILREFYGERSAAHPESRSIRRYYEFVLDSLVETSDLQANQNGYQLLAKAIATLSDFEEDERRHRDQVRNQKILAILTTALVVVGLIQALASYDSKPL